MNKTILAIAFLLLSSLFKASAQSNIELARQKGTQAVKLEDDGKFDEALVLLNDAIKLDPNNIEYPYETAYSYYSQKKYDKAIEVLTKLKDRPDAFGRVYQLLGNSYDLADQNDKAISIYNEGIQKFPNSGELYLESGNIYWVKKDYSKALSFYEKGIVTDPTFPSNYYRASRLYCSSTEKMWGMIYGEIFINLERNSQRTQEISKLLYDTYKSQITFSGDKMSISFTKQSVVTDPKKLPYGLIYEPTIGMASIGQTNIDLNSLSIIRTKFLELYDQKGFDKTYPNALFSYQDQIAKAGLLDTYNRWLLSQGDPDGFKTWVDQNKDKWDNFVKWFGPNPIQLSDTNKFCSSQY
ncbi:tetratricopeptide repeat protein [Mucilaginibacter agri]|uniref:Tetratricopeptide repeat protein n=1 Tax=Mucilaginibacter agri TaxID=2695265 RepID=A0A966DUR8_9SPHI|nr:tetratricopeptide repeat protein [Mucilaginibacter agri]NCD70717.1 tetratricopeptide repeat protein [Mucilaginibacter agri]